MAATIDPNYFVNQAVAVGHIMRRTGWDRDRALAWLIVEAEHGGLVKPVLYGHHPPYRLVELVAALKTVEAAPQSKVGRPAKYDWESAVLAVFGRIFRGEVPDPTGRGEVAEVARLLAQWFSDQWDQYPGETELKKHARRLLKEVKKGDK